jgi:hypothetical protein
VQASTLQDFFSYSPIMEDHKVFLRRGSNYLNQCPQAGQLASFQDMDGGLFVKKCEHIPALFPERFSGIEPE